MNTLKTRLLVFPAAIGMFVSSGGAEVDLPQPSARPSPAIDQFIEAQDFRRELRKVIGWDEISQGTQSQWHDVAVGPDQLRADGTNLVNLSWGLDPDFDGTATGNALNEIADLETDPLGNLIVAGRWDQASTGAARAFVIGVQGANDQTWSDAKQWQDVIRYDDLPGLNPQGDPWDIDDTLKFIEVETDATGRVFAFGFIDYAPGEIGFGLQRTNTTPFLVRYSMVTSSGGTSAARSWIRIYDELPNVRDITQMQVEVSPGGLVYICYRQWDGDTLVAQIDPDADPLFGGDLKWSKTFEVEVSGDIPSHQHVEIRTDRSDRLLLARETGFELVGAPTFKVESLDPFDGSLLWSTDVTGAADLADLEVDFDGNVIILTDDDDSSSNGLTIKFDAITGEELWRDTVTSDGFPIDTAVDIDGNVYTLTQDNGNSGFRLVRILADGTRDWSRTKGNHAPSNLAVGRFGNAFVLARKVSNSRVLTLKYDKIKDSSAPSPNAPVWSCEYQLGDGGIWDQSRKLNDLVVDAGGNAFVGLSKYDNFGVDTAQHVVLRYDQLFESVPTIITDSVDFSLYNRSIWGPNFKEPDIYYRLFKETWNDPVNDISGGNCTSGGYTLRLDAGPTGNHSQEPNKAFLESGLQAAITGGQVDVDYRGDVEIIFPGQEEILPTEPAEPQLYFPAATFFDADNSNGMTAQTLPMLSAGLTGELSVNVGFGLDLCVLGGSDTFNFLNYSTPETGPLPVPFLNLGWFTSVYSVAQGEWVALSDPMNFVTGTMRIPTFVTDSDFNEADRSYTECDCLPDDGCTITLPAMDPDIVRSDRQEKFMSVRANLTNILSTTLLSTPTFVCEGIATSLFRLGYTGSIAQLYVQSEMFGLQELITEFRPSVKYEIRETAGQANPIATYEVEPGQPLCISTPEGLTSIHVTPVIKANATFKNYTALRFKGSVGWETIAMAVAAGAGDSNIIDLDVCERCYEEGIDVYIQIFPTPRFDLVPPGGSPPAREYKTFNIDIPDKKLEGVVINFAESNDPLIIGASRESSAMIIYDQTSPPLPANFSNLMNGVERMVLYGRRFVQGSNIEVHLAHKGRDEILQHELINSTAMLIEVPRRFLTIPGEARIRVESDLGTSNTVGFDVNYPRPNLETVNPNPWAADPTLGTELPAAVLDGLDPLGNFDTFIARRDYWEIYESLWDTANIQGTTAANYFPNWDFNARPAMPAVIVSGSPTARYAQSVENGLLNVTLREEDYDEPGVLTFQLQNPGPGGGLSQRMNLNVGAPIPRVTSISPDIIRPDSSATASDFRILVKGPINVPRLSTTVGGTTWNLESEKRGNFNASSVVYFNDTALETDFFDSALLEAVVPASLLSDYTRAQISVHTPANDSSYFERYSHLEYDDVNEEWFEVVDFTGNVPSGGWSNSVILDIAWEDPVIMSRTVDTVDQYDQDFINASYAVTINGLNFAPDAVVLFDGEPRTTSRASEYNLTVTLSDSDISRPGVYDMQVLNPSDSRASAVFSFTVLAPAQAQTAPGPDTRRPAWNNNDDPATIKGGLQ